MKLLQKKSTVKRRLGVLAFKIYARLEVTEDELALLNQCNLLNDAAFSPEKVQADGLLGTIFSLAENKQAKVHHLINGHEFTCTRLEEVVALEAQLHESALALQNYVLIAASFDQEEVFDLEKLLETE